MAPEPATYERDEDLWEATRSDGRARVRVYRPEVLAVVLGRGSRAELELDLERCRADGVPLLRRAGGGCSVVLDPGQVVVAAAVPAPGLGDLRLWFARLSGWLLAGLAEVGLPDVRREDVSDLALGDRKVGGACMYRPRDVVCYSTTLLVEPRVDLMERYLRHPPREPSWRRGRAHREFVGSLRRPGTIDSARDLERLLEERLRPLRP